MADLLQIPESKRFKLRELKVYSSTEWLADNKKKYRQVFDRYETTYVYAELSFYNKLYDVDDWEIDVELRCYALKKGRKEVCTLQFEKRKVSKFDNVVYIREGWGHKTEGQFWKKGTYYWEAWIEGEKVATKYFYVEDAGQAVTHADNPYLGIQSIKLYEGPIDDIPENERTYLRRFSSEETSYIYVEIALANKHLDKSWQCELFVKFFNNARELKGQVVRLQRVERKDDTIKLTVGWGSTVKGSWRKDRYTAEIVFMDKLLALVPFEVDNEFEEGFAPVLLPDLNAPVVFIPEPEPQQSFEEILARLDAMIGLEQIKQKVRDHAMYLQFLQLRKEKGFVEKERVDVHSVFMGNPGTGKTTVAQMMGKLYKKMGLLTKGHVHEVDRVDLVGEYIGQTAPKVKEAIEKARGGVLFIDEAYALARSNDDAKDFGREVIELLVKEMSNGPGDLSIIVAGYPKEMKHFVDSNPGLRSRFKLFFEFPDYLPQELIEIASFAAVEQEVVLSEPAHLMIEEIITEAFRNRDRTFGNARFVHHLIEQAKINLGLRIMAMDQPKSQDKETLSIILSEDVARIQLKNKRPLPNIPIDESLLQISLQEMDQLIGMRRVKEQIHEMVRLVRYYRESGKDVLGSFYLHTLFVGNPGTGKTTVARILTRLYKALGILERGHMVETDRQGLVAGYVGQTAIKTNEKIEESLGGVLFIDEAYALMGGSGHAHGDFGNEAIQTLLKRMEDDRGKFFVFGAGYPDNMESFLKANPGLMSRFDKTLHFEDYSPEELQEIAVFMLQEAQLTLTEEARQYLANHLLWLYERRDRYFGNARTVRTLVNEIIKRQHLRLAAIPPAERNDTDQQTLILEDVHNIQIAAQDAVFQKKGIGFAGK